MGLIGNEGREMSGVLKVGKNGVMKEVAIVVEFVDGGGAQAMVVMKSEVRAVLSRVLKRGLN